MASRYPELNPEGEQVSLDHVTRSLIVLTSTSFPSNLITIPVPVGVVELAVKTSPTAGELSAPIAFQFPADPPSLSATILYVFPFSTDAMGICFPVNVSTL